MGNYILGTIESAQTACKTFLKLPCSFIVGCEPCKWDHIGAKFERLNFILARGLGLGREILLTDSHRFSSPVIEKHLKVNEVSLLAQPLERKDRATFYGKFAELSASIQEKDNLRSGIALELFYALSSMFIIFLNRRGLLEEIAVKLNLNKLLTIQEHASWDEAAQFFRTLAEAIFEWADLENSQVSTDVVGRVNQYIQENIGGDLSLICLSEIVHLTPFYLSRLYKQQTGQSLTDYIMEEKLLKAKVLLLDTSKKIYQIGLELGFESAPYFNRLFKKMTHMTPQDFREAWGKTNG
ncbi:AraC family transcriptional regulator [Paenibacillus psychroresistens]|uniref:AraC family transcriptional regulator n=1 Tax=Paenibacillus psychroresistens TaxID=1778678 RepID=A0A6B8RG56_9BACL|nr:AraC family transcriptional regulator [Paenibacillus psychroresistens]